MKRGIKTLAVAFSIVFIFSSFNFSDAAIQRDSHRLRGKVKKVQSTSPALGDSERSSLRFRLENIWNEVDLMVRNANADRKDVQRQEKEFKALQVYTKLPIASENTTKQATITSDLGKSIQRFGLKLGELKLLAASKPDRPVPETMPLDAQSFRFTEDQLVQKIRLTLTLNGTKKQLQDWMNSWNAIVEPESPDAPSKIAVTPYLEWDPAALTTLPEMLTENQWKVYVQAYYFRDIRYPKLRPQDPLQILPDWARKNPELFKAQEPFLWGLIEKTQASIPQSLPGYETKARFALNSARMTFFTAKVIRFE